MLEKDIDNLAEEKFEISTSSDSDEQEQKPVPNENTPKIDNPLANGPTFQRYPQKKWAKTANQEPQTAAEFNRIFPNGFHIYSIEVILDQLSGENQLKFFTLRRDGFKIDFLEMSEEEVQFSYPQELTKYLMKRFKKQYHEKIEKDC